MCQEIFYKEFRRGEFIKSDVILKRIHACGFLSESYFYNN